MSPSISRREATAGCFAAAGGLLAGCLDFARSLEPATSNRNDRDDSLPLAYSKSGTSIPGEEVHSGWVHVVSDGESADLTFDARFCDAAGDVEPTARRSHSSEYVLEFETGAGRADAGATSGQGGSCDSGTRLVGGADVPNDWETLVVAVDGAELRTIDRSGTMPELRPLPDPIRVPE